MRVLLLVILSVTIWGCVPKCILEERPEKSLLFGDGGGFRGTERTHMILPNGCVFFREEVKMDWSHKLTLSKAQVKQLYAKAETLGLWEMKFRKPGPVYQYIEVHEGEKRSRVTWGDPKQEIGQEVKDFYQELRAATKKVEE